MRILMRKGWIATTCLLFEVVNGQQHAGGLQGNLPASGSDGTPNSSPSTYFTFDSSQFNGNRRADLAIFVVSGGLNKTFTWRTDDYAAVKYIELLHHSSKENAEKSITGRTVDNFEGRQDSNPNDIPSGPELGKVFVGTPAAESSTPRTRMKARSVRGARQKKDEAACEDLLHSAQHSGGGGSVSLDLQDIALCTAATKSSFAFADPLYFRVTWTYKDTVGVSYSRAFTTVTDSEFASAMDSPIYSVPTPYKPTTFNHTTQDGPSPTGGNQTPGGDDETSNPSSISQPLPPPSKTGLELGAIIGIAVGCGLAGLLAVLGIIWFVVRRRQQKQNLHPIGSFNSDHRGDDLMAEKEAHTGVDVDASPNSPYSDDGHPNGAYPPGTAVTTVAASPAAAPPPPPHLQDQSRSYTPYSDRLGAGAGATPSIRTDSIAHNDEGARANVPSPIPGRATPRGLTTPYAHLVEEGMTEDEIRRLEEEERQLDAAIEQAGRR
ncbi:hypothetical protein QBC41DRAFT_6954 [Cercophora samala]|uniref:Mid2 domain-containing protein n=1 Tax=Cercophora samala TaxID=330535 RepID=A0AA39ZKR5_9PEZI|nr:hypothetical protein QBC41DRAFT_6954 [Cercophora samala]